VHLYLTSAIFQSINSKLKSLSIEALGGRRLSTSQKTCLLKQAGLLVFLEVINARHGAQLNWKCIPNQWCRTSISPSGFNSATKRGSKQGATYIESVELM